MSSRIVAPTAADGVPEAARDEDFYRHLIDELADGVYFVDVERRITFWSRGAERITGYAAAEVVGSRCADNVLMHVDAQGTCLCEQGCPLAATMQDRKARAVDVFLHHKKGHRVPVSVRSSPICDRYARVVGCVETFHENSARQADLERIKNLEQLAFLDELTGLANRRHLDSALSARLSEMARHAWRFGLILLDIDHFKRFNDDYGHNVGDLVLQMVAKTLSQSCRPHDTVGRWGGEEFLIVALSVGRNGLLELAERLRALVAASSLDVGDKQLGVTVSLGATSSREDDDSSTIMQRVDSLLYDSKSAGRNRVSCDT